ncbi:MAG: MATE family efflux transporter [Clostridiales bacterium]|nr:MATE family efflux transporter [Clostridiales bacterium]
MTDNEVSNVQTENPLGTEPIGRLLRRFAVPSCISMIVNALYNIVDQIFIGRGVGYLGNGATSVILPLTVLALGVSFLFGDGCAAFYSMKLGEKKPEEAANSVGTAVLCAVIGGIVLGVVCSIFLSPLCWLTGATEAIYPYAMDYGRVIVAGLPMVVFFAGMSSIVRADGSPGYSMAGLLTGCVTNIVLDYIFVFPLDMGVRGAAIATILGQAANTVIFLFYFRRFRQVRITKKNFRIRLPYVRRICQLGISSFIIQMSIVVIMIVTNKLLVFYGAKSKYGSDIPLTAMGVTMKINNILIAIMNGIAAGALPIIGFNYGARNLDRVKKTIKMSVGIAMLCGVAATFFFQMFPEQIISIFGSESDLYVEFSVLCLRVFLLLCVLDGMNNVIPTCFQAVGRPGYSALSSCLRQLILNIPPAIIAPVFVGVTGILWNGPIACASAFIINIIMIRKIFRKLEQEMGRG